MPRIESGQQKELPSPVPDKLGLITRYFSILVMQKYAPRFISERSLFIQRKTAQRSRGDLEILDFNFTLLPEDAKNLGTAEEVTFSLFTSVDNVDENGRATILDRYGYSIANSPDNWRIDDAKQVAWRPNEIQVVHHHAESPDPAYLSREEAYIYFSSLFDNYDLIPVSALNDKDRENLPHDSWDNEALEHQDSEDAKEWIISFLHATARTLRMENELRQIEKIIFRGPETPEEE